MTKSRTKADASELQRLRELHCLPRNWATKGRLAELKRPKPRPELWEPGRNAAVTGIQVWICCDVAFHR